MAGWGDEVKEGVHAVVSETGITLDAGFFSKDVVVLAFEVANNL